ncbi:PH domain-containing protein [Actinokineospora sp. G85]|uniref:PH domain-containing protein n=1 Tax=Actinokineospora sp. G85 TaxID=3406626 RepID=UPI003C71D026
MAEQQVPTRLVFRVPGVAVLAALLLAICATPVAFGAPFLWLIYLVPLAIIAWVSWARTVADVDGLTARGLRGSRRIAWSELAGLRLTGKGAVLAVLAADSGPRPEVALPHVRTRHVPALSVISRGLVPDPTEGERLAEGQDGEQPVVEAGEPVDGPETAGEPQVTAESGEPAAKSE